MALIKQCVHCFYLRVLLFFMVIAYGNGNTVGGKKSLIILYLELYVWKCCGSSDVFRYRM